MGPGGGLGRWNAPYVSGKSVEIQRSQIDELFRSLQSGEELEEAERRTCFPFYIAVIL